MYRATFDLRLTGKSWLNYILNYHSSSSVIKLTWSYVIQVKSKADLYKAFDDYNVGDQVILKIQRGSENLELPITLEEKSS